MAGLHRLKVDNGIFLDEKRLYGVREYSVVLDEEDDQATLTIKIDVTILSNKRESKLNTLLNESSE